MLVKGHRTDPIQVWMCQTLTMPRTMLSKNPTWIPLWRRASEAMRRRRVGPGTEGLGSHCDHGAPALGMDLGECGRDGEEGWRKKHVTPEPRRLLETQDSGSCTRMGAPTGNQQKSNERLGEGRHPDVHQTVEGRTLTDVQIGQPRAILTRATQTRARMWSRGRFVSGLSEQSAHIREKAPEQTNLEEMHLPHRDMLLIQKDTQLLEWARNNRTDHGRKRNEERSGEQRKQRER